MGTVNKAEITRVVAENSGMQVKQAAAVIDALLGEIARRAEHGDTVRFNGFGAFSVKARPARQGRNPKTGEALEIPESRKLTFKASTASA